jgi:hypothetical protein
MPPPRGIDEGTAGREHPRTLDLRRFA